MTDRRQPEVARTYTRMLRIPRVIGKLWGGFRIPGGPFTFTQLFAAVLAVLIVRWSMALVGIVSPLAVIFGLLAAGFATAVGVGYLPRTMRNILTLSFDAASVAFAPSGGRVAARPPRFTAGWSGRNRPGDIEAIRQLVGTHSAATRSRMLVQNAEHQPGKDMLHDTHSSSPPSRALGAITGVERLRALAAGRKDSSA